MEDWHVAIGLPRDIQTGTWALLQAGTGRDDPGVTTWIDASTGEAVFNMSEAQAALRLTDKEVVRAVRRMEARGRATQVDPSKLATIR